MSTPPPTRSWHQRATTWPRLSLLTALVLLAHGSLLMGAPVFFNVAPGAAPVPMGPVFTTRTLDIPPPPAAPLAPAAPPPVQASNTPPALIERAQPAIENIAEITETPPLDAPPVAAQEPSPPLQLAAATPATPPVGAGSGGVGDTRNPPYALPEPASLGYDVQCEIKGFPCSMQGELMWQHDGKTYNAKLEIKHFLLGSRSQTSTGQITAQGLEPLRFGDKVRSEVAAHFERKKGKISYSANTPDEVLQPGAQDQLSVFMQLAGLLGASPQHYPVGTPISFQAVGPRSSETWVFVVGNTEKLVLPGGTVSALRLSRPAVNENDSNAEIWLAPGMGYLPVRIRLGQPNGDFVDQRWNGTLQ